MGIKYGCDLSKYQNIGTEAGHDFCILRAGYGNSTQDPKYEGFAKACQSRGIPFGVYWFMYATTVAGAIKNADKCVEVIRKVGIRPEYPVYCDLEYDTNRYFKQQTGRDMTVSEINEFTKAFCKRLEELGYYAGVYCNKDYWNKYKLDGRYTIWYARWYAGTSFDGLNSEVHMIQYTDSPYDKDVCRIDFPSVMRKAHLNGF